MIVCYEPGDGGALVTIADENGDMMIVPFDLADCEHFAVIARAVRNVDSSLPQDERVRITERGLELLRTKLTEVSR